MVNEIHKCSLPDNVTCQVFKTPEAIETSCSQSEYESFSELKDPRTNKTLKPSEDLISDYGYSSLLTITEHKLILNSLQLNIIHNPILLIDAPQRTNNRQQITAELRQKQRNEIEHYNKCAEIFFTQNMQSNLLSDEMRSFLISKWSEIGNSDKHRKYQIITTIFRDQACDIKTQEELQDTLKDDFNHEAYLISKENFPVLDRISCEDLRFHSNRKHNRTLAEPLSDCNVTISLDLLSKLLSKDFHFSVNVDNHINQTGEMLTTFEDPRPYKEIGDSTALEEIVTDLLHLSINYYNMNAFLKQSTEKLGSYRLALIDDMMKRNYTKFQEAVGLNDIQRKWIVTSGGQSFNVCINHLNVYFIKQEDNSVTPANASVKIEFQTKFGAERMTRDELIREWAKNKFTPNAITVRFRVDAITLTIISISCMTIQEIEKELKEIYKTDPNDLLANITTVLACYKRLPLGHYKIQAKVDKSSSQLCIYKSSLEGSDLEEEPLMISDSRHWISIDEATPTFLHRNHQHSPSCFPNIQKKRQMSYLNHLNNKNKKGKIPQPPKQRLRTQKKPCTQPNGK